MKIKLVVQKIGFRGLLVVLLLGVCVGQDVQNKKLINEFAINTSKSNQEIALLKLEHIDDVLDLKQVIRKFSSDIKKDVKVLYSAQVNTATSYSNRVCETDSTPNITASNEYVTDFTLAVSRDLYENGWTFGKIVYIEELGEFVKITDLMNKRFCKRVDVFNTNTKEAINFGKRKITAYLLNDVKLKRKRL